jgi:hypothetical protein
MVLLLVILLVALMIPVSAVILDSPLGRALANRIERTEGRDITAGSRVAQLEAEVERLAREVSRLDDEATFVRQLLDQRAAQPQLPAGGDDTAS